MYVTATDKDGATIADMQPAEFEVKLGSKKLDVIEAGQAKAPLRVALIVSDAGTGGFQLGIARFMQRLAGNAEFALISVIVQPERIVDYTADGGALNAGLRRLGPRGQQRGAQLMETILDVAKDIGREGARRAILVARVGAENPTTLSGEEVREQLRKSGATLYVISTLGAQRALPSQARPGISAEQAQLRGEEDSSGVHNLAVVLGDGSRETGGRHDQVISTTMVPAFEQVAEELLRQYALTCVLPEGAKLTDKVSVSTKRKGAKLRFANRLPI